MVQLWFPGLSFGGWWIQRGQFLDVSLLGVQIVVPPDAMQILPWFKIWDAFLLFDSDWIVNALAGAFLAIPNAVWGFLQSFLSGEVSTYYKTHHSQEHIERWLGVRRGDPNWIWASEFDLNNDGVVDSKDVEYFNRAIKRES